MFRHTGVRVEELLELSHHSLTQYRLPSTGELVPLLQIAPSKTDTERLLVASPELADVLSTVIRRVRGPDGAIPLVCAHDSHERCGFLQRRCCSNDEPEPNIARLEVVSSLTCSPRPSLIPV